MALRKILSVFGKLGMVALLAVAFAFGLVTTVYLSLRSPNVQVPDVTNKSYLDGEKTLGKAGLDISQRATRYKPDVPPGIILDQTPHAGEVVKGGQIVRVVVSRAPKEGETPPNEAVAEERKSERGTEGLDENRNQNANRRRNTNRNSNANSNASSNTNVGANTNAGAENAHNANSGNTGLFGNRNAAPNRNSNAGANTNRNRNSNAGVRTTNTSRPTNANRRPTP
ncbi:MAG: PASTA domain-containing protein [Acidobacteriota bacterium]|nr:PASTA domain-containing protein [Acidobacteriota bacterium]MDQ5838132.1 PASTA domain-containing protein [Acidobacteriota bacterium]